MNLLGTARLYIKNGWSVFPIPYGKKEPIIKWGEYRERYATDEELSAWFNAGKHNIGIATGRLSNLSVLDADGSSGLQRLSILNLHSVGTVITGNGGKHLYFQHTGERNKWTSEGHEGLDLRGEGGFVVAPPSLHPCGMTYRWVTGAVPNASILSEFPQTIFPSTGPALAPVIKPLTSEPWVLTALQNGTKVGSRHRELVKLTCYLIPRHSLEVVKHMILQWNQKNNPPIPESDALKQVDDLAQRFAKGQYTSRFVPIQEKKNGTTPLDIGTPAQDADSYITTLSVTPKPAELPTGFNSLDEAIWGIRRGDVTTIGARPGAGKTSFAINVASHLCKLGKRVLYFSTEMSKAEIYTAIFASESGINSELITNKQLTESDKRKLIAFLPTFKTYDIHVVNLFRPETQAVSDAVEKVKPDVLIFDHIQHISSGDKQYADIDRFTKYLKQVAMENNIGVLVASQLHRGAALDGIVPELHHLKGCGTIEEESSVVILLHNTKKDQVRPILFRIAKNRHGKCGDTTLLFEASTTTFKDMAVKVQ